MKGQLHVSAALSPADIAWIISEQEDGWAPERESFDVADKGKSVAPPAVCVKHDSC